MTILAMKARPESLELAVVGCGIGGEEYGISVEQVREVLRSPEITGIPGQPEFIVGLMKLRGYAIPVIDLRIRFGLPAPHGRMSRVVVAAVKELLVAFLVDSVSAIRKLEASAIRPLPSGLACRGSAFLRGVAPLGVDSDRWLLLLDLDRVFSIEEENALRKVDEGKKA
ncbi:MAG: chemotaxis protein CheW [Candidatus Hydrogenedentota bacterium]